MHHLQRLTIALLTCLALTACHDESDNVFTSLGAFFRFTPVTAAPKTLFPALGNPGQWCIITVEGNYYQFRTPDGKTDTYPKTALEQYGAHVWMSGLIVGTPTIPDITTGTLTPVCYDLICPNCYLQNSITRAVTLSPEPPARAYCSRCSRCYDLELNGNVVEGATSAADYHLFRYRCSYNNDTFVVQN